MKTVFGPINQSEFAQNLMNGPFRLTHQLARNELFQLSALVDLASRLPFDSVEYNAGDLPTGIEYEKTPKNGLSVEETIRRIEECSSWMAIKWIENDETYREFLYDLIKELEPSVNLVESGVCRREGFIFVSSANAVTPYHLDHEHNFLMQVKGSKRLVLFDRNDHLVLPTELLEKSYRGGHRNLPYHPSMEERGQIFDMHPGDVLYIPPCWPHHVKVGPEYSISLSVTFRTRELNRFEVIQKINGKLRQIGLPAGSPSRHRLADKAKLAAFGAARLISRSMGRPASRESRKY